MHRGIFKGGLHNWHTYKEKSPQYRVGQVIQGGFVHTDHKTLRLQNLQRCTKYFIAHFCGRSNAIMRKVELRWLHSLLYSVLSDIAFSLRLLR